MTAVLAGAGTLFRKEVLRFWKVAFQTVAAPVLTAVMYLLVFGHALNGRVSVYDGVSGVSSTNTRLPMILLWMIDDELLANAFCSTLIITRPGMRKLV